MVEIEKGGLKLLKTTLIQSTTVSRLDCSGMSTVTAIEVTNTAPAGSVEKIVFKTGSGWQKYNVSTSAWVDVATQTVTAASVLSEGNTIAEIEALGTTALAAFVGKSIDYSFAMSIDSAATIAPSLTSIKAVGASGSTVTAKTLTSDSIPLSSDGSSEVDIIKIDIEKTEVAGGTVTVKASTQNKAGTWSNYVDYTTLITTPPAQARAIKFKADFTAPNIGTSIASLASISIKHRTDNVAVMAEGTGVCITKTYSFIRTMSKAHLMVKHPTVKDTDINAYVSLRPEAIQVTQEVLGVGDGAQHTYTLKHPVDIASHTFKLYFNGEPQSAGFAVSSTDGQVTATAPAGASVTADYKYNWKKETFTKMAFDADYSDTQDETMVKSQFDYIASTDADPTGAVSSIKIELIQKSGTVKAEAVGSGSGALASFELAHKAKPATLRIYAGGTETNSYTYKELTNTLFVTAAKGLAITADYDWAADTTYIDNFAVIWNE